MTDLATLGLAIDSSPAAKAVSDLDRLTVAASKTEAAVDEMGNASARAGKSISSATPATKQLEAAISAYSGANDNAVGAINRHVAAIQKLTEAERRLSSSLARGADIAAYGKELDGLRAKFNPLFATIQNYKGAQEEIRRAHAVGAISTQEMAAALSRERQSALSSIAALKSHRAAIVENANAVRSVTGASSSSFNTANIAAQFQDIAVTAQMGMAPIQIALQQGTQLASVLTSMDKPLAGLVAGFGSLFSVTSLLTIGLVAAGAAALQWLFSAKNDADKLDDAFQKHAKTIDELRRLYGEAATAADNLASAGGDAFSFATIRNDAETLRNVLQMQQQVMAQSLKGDSWLSGLWGGSNGSIDKLRNLSGEQIKFKGAVDTFLDSVRRGGRDLDGFRTNVESIFQTLLQSSDNPTELRATADAIEAMGEAATDVAGKFAPFSDAINKLVLDFAEGRDGIIAFNREVSRIGAGSPSLQKLADEAIVLGQNIVKATEKLRDLEIARFRETERIRDRLASERNDVGQSFYQDRERQLDLENRILDAQTQQNRALTDQERIFAAGEVARARNPVKGDEQRRQVAIAERQERERLDQEARVSAMDRAREREEAVRGAQEEISLIGKTIGEAASLRAEYQMMAAVREEAARTGREVSEGEIAAIKATSAAIGELTQKMATANTQRDLLFEREQMGRTKTEQRVASQLRDIYGDDYKTQLNGALAGQIRLNEKWKEAQDELREIGDIGKDALGGLVDILYESGNAAENLLSLFAGIGRQFARMGMDKLMKSITGQGGGFDLSSLSGLSKMTPQGGSATMQAGKEIGAAVAPVIKSSLTVGNNDLAGNIQRAAATLGTSARDLATVISYETGGSFSTSVRGGAGNRHIGLIQFGPAEQKKYGAAIGQTISAQMDAVIGYLQDRGFKPGMGLLDLYSTINAGRPGLYNRSDAKNGGAPGTVADKVNYQMSGHQANADRILGKTAVRDGVIDANRKLQQDAHVQAWRAQDAGGATTAQMSKMEAALGVGGAALGAFAGGMQSGSPIMGGISGAFSGAGAAPALSALDLGAAAMPIGIIGGAILGIVGGIIGKNRQKKQERNAARQQLNQNKSALEELFARGEGRGIGATTQAYNEFYDQTAQLDEIAQKAGDDELVKKLRDNVNKFFVILEKDFIGKFPGMIEAYSSGLGSDSPFVQGASAMEQLREELKNFVADAQTFGELQLKNARDLTPEQLEQRVKAAQEAAQKMALAALAGVEPLSQMEEELLRVKGASATLQTTLEQLGMSAEQAAASIDTATTTALNKLRDGFMKDITSSLNELSGVGYINDIMAAQDAYQARLKDSAALGIDSSYALRELSLSLKDIVQSAGLTREEIGLLSQTFPELQFALKGWSQDTLTLAEATSQLQAAYENEASALEDAISKNKAWIASIKQFRDAMKINDNSPLAPDAKVEEAAKQFREIAAKAMGGDEDALGQLTSISQDYLDEAQAYYTSSVKYFEIWKEVDATLDKVQKASEGNLSESQRQLDALKASVNGILKIDESVLSVKDALAQYNTALTANLDTLKTQLGMVGTNAITEAYHNALGRDPEAAGMSYWQDRLNTGSSVSDVQAGITGSREAEINKLYNAIFNRNLDAASAQYWVGSNKSIAEIEADLKYAKSMGAYANGGFHEGGLRLVGERGPEIEATGPSRIWSASQTRAMLQPTGGGGEVAAEIKALRQENAELRAAVREVAKTVAYAGDQQIAEMQQVNRNLANVGSELLRVAGSR